MPVSDGLQGIEERFRLGQKLHCAASKLGLWLALLVPASALAALALHAYRAYEVPSERDWTAAALWVRESFRPGDIVAFVPGWAQEGRGHFRGLHVLPQERWTAADLSGANRLFVVSSFGADPPRWLEPLCILEETREFGQIRVLRLALPKARERLADLVSLVPSAKVTLEAPGRVYECPRQADRHDCTEARFPWRYVGETQLLVEGSARRCIWAHPTTGARLVIAFPPVPLGERLVVFHGLADSVAQGGAPVTLGVWVGDRELASIPHPAQRGWRETSLGTAAWQGRSEPLTFVVTTLQEGARHFCFAAETVK
jgi:hypothetical protein